MTVNGEQYFEVAASTESPRSARDGFFACPCCNEFTMSEAGGYEICEVCDWEDDPVQETTPNLAGGANKVSLDQARMNYRLVGLSDPAQQSRSKTLR